MARVNEFIPGGLIDSMGRIVNVGDEVIYKTSRGSSRTGTYEGYFFGNTKFAGKHFRDVVVSVKIKNQSFRGGKEWYSILPAKRFAKI